MKKILLFILLSFQIFTEALVFYGDDSFSPYSYTENSEMKGIDIEILGELESRTGYKIDVKLVPWSRLLELTKLGKIDGSFSLFKTQDREEYALFTKFPIHYSEYSVFSLEDKSYKSLSDFYGKTVGLNTGFYISDEFQDLAAKGRFTLIESENINNHINQLLNKRIDFYVGNTLVVEEYLKKNKLTNLVVRSKTLIKSSTPAFLVLSKASDVGKSIEVLTTINKAIESIHRDGTYKKIVKKYE